MCLDPIPSLSVIQPLCPTPPSCPQYPSPHLAIAALIWSLTAPYPLLWPMSAHHLELLSHATPTTSSNCHLALMHPSSLSPGHLALLAILPLPHLAPCHQPSAPPPLPSGPPIPPLSYPTTPSNCHLTLLPPVIPYLPCYLALLTLTPCPIWLPAISPPAPTTPTPIWTSCPHPTKYHHQRFPPPKKEI